MGWSGNRGNRGKLGAPRTSPRGKVCANRKDTVCENDNFVTLPSVAPEIAQICSYSLCIQGVRGTQGTEGTKGSHVSAASWSPMAKLPLHPRPPPSPRCTPRGRAPRTPRIPWWIRSRGCPPVSPSRLRGRSTAPSSRPCPRGTARTTGRT